MKKRFIFYILICTVTIFAHAEDEANKQNSQGAAILASVKGQENIEGTDNAEAASDFKPVYVEAMPGTVKEKDLPPFDAGDAPCLVVDGGLIYTPGRFTIGIQVFNYSSDKNIKAEVYGYGGKFKDEWHLINPITMDRFNLTPKLFHPIAKYDYTHYQYFAIKILKPKNKKYQIVSDQQNENLNFYIWDVGANSTATTSMVGNTVNVAPKIYVIDPQELADEGQNNIFLDSNKKLKDLPINLYVYNTTKKVLVYYGAVTLADYMDRQKMRKAIRIPVDDFRVNSYNININKNAINVIIMDDGK